MPHFIGQTVYEKSVTIFFTPVTLFVPREIGQSSPKFDIHVQQGPLYQAVIFRPLPTTPLRDNCYQSSSISWTAWPTKTPNYIVSHTMRRLKSCGDSHYHIQKWWWHVTTVAYEVNCAYGLVTEFSDSLTIARQHTIYSYYAKRSTDSDTAILSVCLSVCRSLAGTCMLTRPKWSSDNCHGSTGTLFSTAKILVEFHAVTTNLVAKCGWGRFNT